MVRSTTARNAVSIESPSVALTVLPTTYAEIHSRTIGSQLLEQRRRECERERPLASSTLGQW